MANKHLRMSLFIGGAILLAGAVLVVTRHASIPADRTQGAIGQRDVYRDPQSASDLKVQTGSAPVAVRTIMESKEFKKIASQPEYKSLVNSEAFAALLSNPQAMQAAASPKFTEFLASYAKYLEAQSGSHSLGAQSNFMYWAQSNVQQNMLANFQQYAVLANSPAFASLVRSNGFLTLAMSQNFQSFAHSSEMASLLQSAQFQAAANSFASSGAARVE